MGKNKKFNFVYLTTNLINGKQYIGDHSTNNINDNYLGSGKIIESAIKKYRKENFKREILEYFDIRENASDSQEKYINQYDTLIPNGYNINPKGGNKVSEQTIENISKGHIGVKQKPQTIEKIKNTLKNRIFSDVHKQKLKNLWKLKEHLEKIEQTRIKNSVICEHCGKKCYKNIYNRFHGEKCKYNPKNIKIKIKIPKPKLKRIENFKIKWGEEEGIRRYKLYIQKISEKSSNVSEKTKEKRRISLKSKKEQMIEKILLTIKSRMIMCQYCHKLCYKNIYNRFHGEKCKCKK